MTTHRILVVEDDEHVLTLLREMLEQEGYEVALARDGLAGLLTLRNIEADAVLLDIMMPDVDGERLLAQLLDEHDGTLPVPVLVITGSPDGARRCRAVLGDADVFTKPFDPGQLLARLTTRLA